MSDLLNKDSGKGPMSVVMTKWWFWLFMTLIVLGIIGSFSK